jgi:hypothetical protein
VSKNLRKSERNNITIRKLSPLVLLAAVFVVFLLTVRYSKAQDQDKDKSRSISSLTQVAEGLHPEFGPVRFHREEKFEDNFIVRGISASVLAFRPNFYQIQGERFDQSGRTFRERFDYDLPTMYVATSRDESNVYRLAGFPEAEESFNRLVREGPNQKILTNGDAMSRGLLCAEVVYGLSPNWWVGGISRAKLKAAEHFFAEGHEDSLLLAERWWKSAKGNRETLNITTTKSGGVFSVNVPVFWAPVPGPTIPEVKLYRIEVSDAGTCRMTSAPAIVLR